MLPYRMPIRKPCPPLHLPQPHKKKHLPKNHHLGSPHKKRQSYLQTAYSKFNTTAISTHLEPSEILLPSATRSFHSPSNYNPNILIPEQPAMPARRVLPIRVVSLYGSIHDKRACIDAELIYHEIHTKPARARYMRL
jgi:hypothetical protein